MLVKDLLLISCILYQINACQRFIAHILYINTKLMLVKDLLLISCILYQINACQRFIAHILYIIPN